MDKFKLLFGLASRVFIIIIAHYFIRIVIILILFILIYYGKKLSLKKVDNSTFIFMLNKKLEKKFAEI